MGLETRRHGPPARCCLGFHPFLLGVSIADGCAVGLLAWAVVAGFRGRSTFLPATAALAVSTGAALGAVVAIALVLPDAATPCGSGVLERMGDAGVRSLWYRGLALVLGSGWCVNAVVLRGATQDGIGERPTRILYAWLPLLGLAGVDGVRGARMMTGAPHGGCDMAFGVHSGAGTGVDLFRMVLGEGPHCAWCLFTSDVHFLGFPLLFGVCALVAGGLTPLWLAGLGRQAPERAAEIMRLRRCSLLVAGFGGILGGLAVVGVWGT